MEPPPPLLAWLGVLGGFLSVFLAFLEIHGRWRNRHRLNFRVLLAQQATDTWTSADVERFKGTNPYNFSGYKGPSVDAPFKPGDVRRVFTILEFVIENQYPKDITISNMVVNGVIYADRVVPTMMSSHRDYRVYDLYTSDMISLDRVVNIPAGRSVGIHLEFIDEAFDRWQTKSAYVIEPRKTHVVKYKTSIGTKTKRIKPRHIEGTYGMRRWSELLGPIPSHFPPPDGWPSYQPPLRTRARWWVDHRIRKLLYGPEYWVPGRPNRIKKFFNDRRDN